MMVFANKIKKICFLNLKNKIPQIWETRNFNNSLK